MGNNKVDKRLFFLLVFLLTVAALLLYTKVSFTGLSIGVIGDYDNKTDCEFYNYTWENVTETYCNYSIEGCVLCEPEDCVKQLTGTVCTNFSCEYNCTSCNETSCIDIPGCTLCEQGCVKETLCNNLSCEYNCTLCKDIVIGGQCVGELCGNGVLDTGEECDDGNENETDTCNNCMWTTCGDGIVQSLNGNNVSEVCDDGVDYNGEYSYCASDCLSEGPYCGDDTCDSEEDCSGCSADCGECEEEDEEDEEIKTTTLVKGACTPNWQCDEWSECVDGMQSRSCVDSNACGSQEGVPITSQTCEVVIEETCFDGVKNQDETGIDCGGSCEKSCGFFTIVGSAISGPIEGMFGNTTRSIISIGIFVLLIGGFIAFQILKRKGLIDLKKLDLKKFVEKKFGNFSKKRSVSDNENL